MSKVKYEIRDSHGFSERYNDQREAFKWAVRWAEFDSFVTMAQIVWNGPEIISKKVCKVFADGRYKVF